MGPGLTKELICEGALARAPKDLYTVRSRNYVREKKFNFTFSGSESHLTHRKTYTGLIIVDEHRLALPSHFDYCSEG